MRFLVLIGLAMISVTGTKLLADDENPAKPTFLVGTGAAYAPDYEGSDDYQLFPGALAQVSNFAGKGTTVGFGANGFQSNFLPDSNWRLGVAARYVPAYSEKDLLSIDDMQVARLQENESTIETGFIVGYTLDAAGWHYLVDVTLLADIENGHGHTATPRLRASRMLSPRFMFDAGIAFSWANTAYMSNRFGISMTDAIRSGLDQHATDAEIKNVSIDANAMWFVNEHWALAGFVAVNRLTGSAATSPIVADRGETTNWVLGGGVTYRF